MFVGTRWQEIVRLVNERGSITVKELASILGMSTSTIRNDLIKLESLELLDRKHGGAIARNSSTVELRTRQKELYFTDEKKRIAQQALSLIAPHSVIGLDTGTTTLALAELITDDTPLTIITNDFQIAASFEQDSKVETILVGGNVRHGFYCTYGSKTVNDINQYNIDIAFLGANGFSLEKGFMTPVVEMAQVKRSLIRRAKTTAVLSDSSKLNVTAMVSFADFSEIDYLITDNNLNPEVKRQIEARDTIVLVDIPAGNI
ncbi:MAG: DeoR/GlpR transcriptional regulator [Clostridiaceae bacterium]|nr:DeoR/GlpR transcriptional regulator [Clostridiaceae bacterium]